MLKSERDFEIPLRKGKATVITLMALLCSVLSGAAPVFPAEDKAPIIQAVFFKTEGFIGQQNLEELISIKRGDPYSLKKIDQSIKQIFRTGLYSDVRVIKSGAERVDLTFLMIPKLFIRSIAFSGEKDLAQVMMSKGLESLRKGDGFSGEKLEKAIAELQAGLEQVGFFRPVIKTKINKDQAESAVDVTFVIESWKEFLIGAIDFEGHRPVSEKDMRKHMKSRAGSPYVPSTLREDLLKIKDLYDSLGYRRVIVDLAGEEFDERSGLVRLRIRVWPGEKISLVIRGAKVPEKLLAPIWEERVFEEWGLAEGENRILAYLRKKGYLKASLKSRIERQEDEIQVIYEITLGSSYRVDRVEFEGLVSFLPSRIKNEVGIGEKIPFFSLMDGQRLFDIPGKIEAFYQMNGFPDCHVELALKSLGRAATAVFSINEGRQQKIDRIVFSGISQFPQERIRAEMTNVEGGSFYSPNVQKDIEKIETYYLDRGVKGTKASAEIRLITPETFSLFIQVSEGRHVRIAKIIVTGNKATRKKAILREVLLKEGDEASRSLILETKRRLGALGIFSEIGIDEVSISPDAENLVIAVREGKRNYASVGVGLETKNEPRSLAIWENNIRVRGTAEFIRNNVFGMASQVSLVSQFSLIERRAVLSWEQHYFLGMPLQTVINGWLEEENRTSFGFKRRGVSLNGVKPLSKDLIILGTISLSETKLTYLDIAESEIGRQLFPYSIGLVSGSLIWDRRNDTFNPSRGFFLSFVGEWAYPLFKTESNFLKAFAKFQAYKPVLSHLNLSLTIRFGLGRGRMPIPERFFAGGSNSFRGERFDELGPKDPGSMMPIGGKAMFLMNLEMKFPLIPNLTDLAGAVFYDVGQVFANRKDFSLFGLRGALGFGLRYRTPLGPVRFDIGWNIDDPQKKGRPLIFITIGNMF